MQRKGQNHDVLAVAVAIGGQRIVAGAAASVFNGLNPLLFQGEFHAACPVFQPLQKACEFGFAHRAVGHCIVLRVDAAHNAGPIEPQHRRILRLGGGHVRNQLNLIHGFQLSAVQATAENRCQLAPLDGGRIICLFLAQNTVVQPSGNKLRVGIAVAQRVLNAEIRLVDLDSRPQRLGERNCPAPALGCLGGQLLREDRQIALGQFQLGPVGNTAHTAGAAAGKADPVDHYACLFAENFALLGNVKLARLEVKPIGVLIAVRHRQTAGQERQLSAVKLQNLRENLADAGGSQTEIGYAIVASRAGASDKAAVTHHKNLLSEAVEPVFQRCLGAIWIQPALLRLRAVPVGGVKGRSLHQMIIIPLARMDIREKAQPLAPVNRRPIRNPSQISV